MALHPFTLLITWLIALVLTPVLIRLSTRRGWLDHPRDHKQHGAPIPVVGGIAVFLSMAIGLFVMASVSEPIRAELLGSGFLLAYGGPLVAIVALGAYDDRRDMSPFLKLAGQVVIAGATWYLGIRCGELELPFGWVISGTFLPSLLLTVGWIVLVTNAFNLIDGLDGLAAGIGILASLMVFVLANEHGASFPVMVALGLAGALSGFLRSNTPPARIYLGDAGSMAIGYTIAVIALSSYQKAPTAVVLVVPFILLGLPLLDTLGAVVRRFLGYLRSQDRNGFAALEVGRAVFRADRSHVHHLLLRLGWSDRRVLFTLYAICGSLGVLGLWMRETSSEIRWFVWLMLIVVGVSSLRRIQTRVERRERSEAADPPIENQTRAAG